MVSRARTGAQSRDAEGGVTPSSAVRRRQVDYSVVCDFGPPQIAEDELEILLVFLGQELAALLDQPLVTSEANESRPLSSGLNRSPG
jgi:hypothetical protein